MVKSRDTTERSAAALQRRVGRGEFDPSNERVLCMKYNPASQDRAVRTTALDGLRKENRELLDKVEQMEKSGFRGASIEGMVPRQTLENLQTEIGTLEALVAEKEKRMTRLKEVSPL